MQVLYQLDIGKMDVEDAFNYMQDNFALTERDMDFARYVVKGAIDNLEELDNTISQFSREWQLKRMAAVDKNIIRIALYEIFHDEAIPANVSINEAVELAKVFGGEESSKFVNGILGAVINKKT